MQYDGKHHQKEMEIGGSGGAQAAFPDNNLQYVLFLGLGACGLLFCPFFPATTAVKKGLP